MDFEPYFKVHNSVSAYYKKHQTWPNDQSQHDLLHDGVRLSIG